MRYTSTNKFIDENHLYLVTHRLYEDKTNSYIGFINTISEEYRSAVLIDARAIIHIINNIELVTLGSSDNSKLILSFVIPEITIFDIIHIMKLSDVAKMSIVNTPIYIEQKSHPDLINPLEVLI